MNNEDTVEYTNKYIQISRKQLIEKLKEVMSTERLKHVFAVEQIALSLAKQYGEDFEKVSIVALLHDVAKERPDEEMRDIVISENLDLDMLNFGSFIWHGPVGAVLAKREYGVYDEEILESIANHTIGSSEMTVLDQIIFVADYIEPSRTFSEAEEARRLVTKSLEKTVQYIVKKTFIYLVNEEKMIYPKSIDTYNAWIRM